MVTQGQAEFPELLRVPGHPIEWVVVVAVKLDTKGRVTHAAISKSYGETSLNPTTVRYLLNAEALKEATHAAYSPKVVHCKAVPSTYPFQITFTGGR